MGSSIAHRYQQLDDHLLEEARAILKDAFQQVRPKRGENGLVRSFDDLLGRCGRRLHIGSRRDLCILSTAVEVAKEWDGQEMFRVQVRRRFGEKLLRGRGDRKADSFGAFQKARSEEHTSELQSLMRNT